MTVFFLDDAATAPEALRVQALAAAWMQPEGLFQGRQAELPEAVQIRPLLARLAAFLGRGVYYNTRRPGYLRSLLEADEAQKHHDIHIDNGAYVAILNLSLQPHGATRFFRHLPSGLTLHRETCQRRDLMARLCATEAELNAVFFLDGQDAENWQETLRIENRFNRAIVFDTNRFHQAAPGHGADLASSKLTLNIPFALDEGGTPPEPYDGFMAP